MIKKTTGRTAAKVTPSIEPPKRVSNKNFFFIAIILVVVLTAFVLMAINAFKKNDGNLAKGGQNVAASQQGGQNIKSDDVQGLLNRISQLIIVKSDEQPTVATVQDAEILRQGNPLFYKDAENGDRLLVWSDKAVLYSTKMDKLLAVMPISSEQGSPTSTSATPVTQATTTASTVESEKANIEIRNGTLTAGLGKKLANSLKEQKFTVGTVTDAKKKDYSQTVVYKANKSKPLDATMTALVQATKAKVVEDLPGETGVNGDVVVVVGSDFQ